MRFYRRADGTILTGNCPVGLRALKRRVSRITSAAASALICFLSGLGVNLLSAGGEEGRPPQQYTAQGQHTMGAVRVEPRAPLPPPPTPLPFNGPVEDVMGDLGPVGRDAGRAMETRRPVVRLTRARKKRGRS